MAQWAFPSHLKRRRSSQERREELQGHATILRVPQMSPKSVLSSRTLLRTSAYKSSCQKPCPNSICLCLKLPNLRVRPFSRQFVRLSDALSGEETPFASGTTRKCSYCCPCLLHHFSHVQLFATPWTVAHEFPRPGDSPGKNTGVK